MPCNVMQVRHSDMYTSSSGLLLCIVDCSLKCDHCSGLLETCMPCQHCDHCVTGAGPIMLLSVSHDAQLLALYNGALLVDLLTCVACLRSEVCLSVFVFCGISCHVALNSLTWYAAT